MNKLFALITAGALSLGVTSMSEAAFFDLLGTQGADVDNLASGTTTVDGIAATLSATSPAGAELNGSGSNFGINTPASFGSDESTRIDNDNSTEVLTLQFLDESVVFESFTITSGSGATVAAFTIGAFSGTFDFPTGGTTITLNAGDELPLGGITLSTLDSAVFSLDAGGTGYSLDSFTVSTIPEPASVGLVLAGAGLMLGRRRKA